MNNAPEYIYLPQISNLNAWSTWSLKSISQMPRVLEGVEIQTANYSLRFAQSLSELIEAQALRYRVFRADYDIPFEESELDRDSFDAEAYHLLVKERRSGRVIGTYRILWSERVDEFYSETEFFLEDFLNLPGSKIELGRACVDHAHRNGTVLRLLWSGISEAVRRLNVDWMFGCSSVQVRERDTVDLVLRELRQGGVYQPGFRILPKPKYAFLIDKFVADASDEGRSDGSASVLPPLLLSYLRRGAQVWSPPAWDEAFGCIDLFTVLKINREESK